MSSPCLNCGKKLCISTHSATACIWLALAAIWTEPSPWSCWRCCVCQRLWLYCLLEPPVDRFSLSPTVRMCSMLRSGSFPKSSMHGVAGRSRRCPAASRRRQGSCHCARPGASHWRCHSTPKTPQPHPMLPQPSWVPWRLPWAPSPTFAGLAAENGPAPQQSAGYKRPASIVRSLVIHRAVAALHPAHGIVQICKIADASRPSSTKLRIRLTPCSLVPSLQPYLRYNARCLVRLRLELSSPLSLGSLPLPTSARELWPPSWSSGTSGRKPWT